MSQKPYPIANLRPYGNTKNPYGQKIRDFYRGQSFSNLLADEDSEKFKGKWREYFSAPQSAFLNLEIGAYHGETSIHLARNASSDLHLAFEWKYKQCFRAGKKAADANLKNLTFLRANSARIPFVFSPGEIDRLWILFPDPWSKAAHQKWRLLNPGFLQMLAYHLNPGKELLIKTDHAEYAAYIDKSWRSTGLFEAMKSEEAKSRWELIPPTPFERIFIKQKIPIHSFALFRNSESVVLPKEFQEEFPIH